MQTVGIVSANRGQAAQDGQAQLFEINLTFYIFKATLLKVRRYLTPSKITDHKGAQKTFEDVYGCQ